MYLGHGFRRPNFVPKFGASVMGIGPYALWGDEGRHAGSSCPTGGCGEPPRLPGVVAHSGASAARVRRNGRESRQRSSPKCPATPDNPSVALRATAPFAQGSLWGRGFGSPRRFAPRNDSPKPLSFRGAERRGNPSFSRWTGVRAAEVVDPYGNPNHPPKPAGAQRSVRASVGEGWAEISAKTIKRGTTAATAEAALSEAESAEREAGQIRSLPDDLRVQHGAQRSEVSARPRPCSRRGCVH